MELIILLYGIFLAEKRAANLEVLSLTLFFFLVFDLLGIYLYHLLQLKEQLNEELMLSKQKDALEYQHLQQLQEQYEKSRKILHDMKNHILAIEGFCMSESPNTKEYIKEVIESIDKSSHVFQTNSKIITLLLNSKIQKTEEYNILFRAEVQDMCFDFISDLDWVIILGNFWIMPSKHVSRSKQGNGK